MSKWHNALVWMVAGITALIAAGCGMGGDTGSLQVTAALQQQDDGAEPKGMGGGLIAGMDGIRIEVRKGDDTVAGKTFRDAEAQQGVLAVDAIPTGSGYTVIFEGLRGEFVVYHGKTEGVSIKKDSASTVSIAVKPSPGRGDPNTSGVWVIATPPRYVSTPVVNLVLNAANVATARIGNGNEFDNALTIDYLADTEACTADDDPICADQEFRLYRNWQLDDPDAFTQGGKTVSVVFTDSDGYNSEIEFDTVTLDTTDPREQLITLGPIQSNGDSRWLMATLGVIDAYEMCFGMACEATEAETLLMDFVDDDRADAAMCPGDQTGAEASSPACMNPGQWIAYDTNANLKLAADIEGGTIRVYYRDEAYNMVWAQRGLSTAVPESAPVITAVEDKEVLKDGDHVTVSGTAFDPVGAAELTVVSTRLIYDDENATEQVLAEGTVTVTETNALHSDGIQLEVPDGARFVQVEVVVSNGQNNSYAQASRSSLLEVDTEAPSNLFFSVAAGQQFVASATVEVEVGATGASQMRFGGDVAEAGQWMAFSTRTAVLLSDGDGAKTVTVEVRDNADLRAGPESATVTLDTEAPLTPVCGFDPDRRVGDTSVTLTLQNVGEAHMLKISGAGVAALDSGEVDQWQTPPAGSAIVLTLTEGEDGPRPVSVVYRDEAGNQSPSFDDFVTIDTTAPWSAPQLLLPQTRQAVKSGDALGVGGTIEAGADVHSAQLISGTGETELGTTDVTSFISANASGALEGVVTIPELPQGTAWLLLEIIATDGLNQSDATASRSEALTVDEQGLTSPSLVVRNGRVIGTTRWVKSPSVEVELGIVDPQDGDTADVEVKLSGDGIDAGDEHKNRWTAYAEVLSVILSADDGEKSLTAVFRDGAGHETEAVGVTIQLDTQAPAAASMVIREGSQIHVPNVHLYYGTAPTDAYEVRIGGDDVLVITGLTHEWVPVDTFPVGTDIDGPQVGISGIMGAKSVQVSYRDRATNESETQILLTELLEGRPYSAARLSAPNPAQTAVKSGDVMTISGTASGGSTLVSATLYALDAEGLVLSGSDVTSSVEGTWGSDPEVTLSGTVTVPAAGTIPAATASLQLEVIIHKGEEDSLPEDSRGQPIAVDNIPLADAAVSVVEGQYSNHRIITLEMSVTNTGRDTYNDVFIMLSGDGIDPSSGGEGRPVSELAPDTWLQFPGEGTLRLTETDGLKSFTLQMRDGAHHSTEALSVAVTLDTVAPTLGGLSIREGAKVGQYDVTAQLSANGASEYFLNGDVADTETDTGAWLAYPADGLVPVTLSDGEGIKSLWVQYRDEAGNVGDTISEQVEVDSIAPFCHPVATLPAGQTAAGNGTIIVVGGNAESSATLETSALIFFDEFGSEAGRRSVTGISMTQGQLSGSVTVSQVPVGSAACRLEIIVNDGLWSSDAETSRTELIPIDVLAPVNATINFADNAQYTNARQVLVGITVENVGKADTSDLQMQISGSGLWQEDPLKDRWVAFAPEASLTLAEGQGQRQVTVQVRDGAFNPSNTAAATITLDTQAPTSPGVEIQGPDETSQTHLTLSLSCVGADEVKISGSSVLEAINTHEWVAFANSEEEIDIVGQNGSHTVTVQFRDAAGNLSDTVFDTIVFNSTRPVSSPRVTMPEGQTAVKNSDTIAIGGAATSGTEIVTAQLQFGDGSGGTVAAARDLAVNSEIVLNATDGKFSGTIALGTLPAGTASIWLAVVVKRVGSSAPDDQSDPALSVSPATVVDNTPLTDGSLVIEDGAATNGNRVRLLFGVSNPGQEDLSDVMMNVSGDGLAPTTQYLGEWTAFADARDVVLSEGAGTKTIQVSYRDGANHELGPFTASIVYDVTPPDNLGVTINNGDAKTGAVLVDLAMAATDSLPMEMSISGDIETPTDWVPYVPTQQLSLTAEDGIKVVAVTFRDQAGNQAGPVTDSIILDSQPPTSSPVLSAPAGQLAVKNNDIVTVAGQAEAGTSIAQALLISDADATLIDVTSQIAVDASGALSGSFNVGDLTGVASIVVQVVVSDGVNSSAAAQSRSTALTIDNQLPVISADFDHSVVNQLGTLLNMTGTDALEYRLSGDLQDGSYSSWSPFVTAQNIVLTDVEGEHSVTVQVRDGAFNTASTGATISVDRVVPTSDPAIVPPAGQITLKSGDVISFGGSVEAGCSLVSASLLDAATEAVLADVTARIGIDAAGAVSGSYTMGDPLTAAAVMVEVVVSDGANESIPEASRSAAIDVDTSAPINGSIVIAGGESVTGTRDVTLTLAAEGALEMFVAGNVVSETGVTFSWISYSSSLPVTLTEGDGDKTVSVRYRDGAFNELGPLTDTINLNTGPVISSPVLTPPGGQQAIKLDDELTVSGSIEAGGTIVSARLMDVNAATVLSVTDLVVASEAGVLSGSITLPDTGTATTIRLEVIARARGAQSVADSSRSLPLTVDNDDPVITSATVDPSVSNSATVSLTTVASDATTALEMFLDGDITGSGIRQWVTFSGSVSLTLDTAEEGTKIVSVRVRDAAHHEAQKQKSVVYDITAPFSNPTLAAPAGQTAIKSNDIVSFGGNAEPGTTMSSALLVDENGATFMDVASSITFDPDTGAFGGSVNVSDVSAVATLALRVLVNDGANTSETAQSVSAALPVDVGVPTVAVDAGGNYSNSPQITLSIATAGDAYQMRISGDVEPGAYSDWAAFADTVAVTLAGSDGAKSVTVAVRDGAFNTGSDTVNVTLDSVAPSSAPQLVLPNGQTRIKNGDTLSVAGSASGAASIVHAWLVNDSGTMISDVTSSVSMNPLGDFSGSFAVDSLTDGALLGIEVVVSDNINESLPSLSRSQFYLADNTAPTDGSIEIAGGSAVVGGENTTVTLSATGATEAYISGDVVTTEYTNTWVAYAASVAVILEAGDTTKTVTVLYRDEAHNQFGPASDTVQLNTGAVTSSPVLNPPAGQIAVKSNDQVSVGGNSEAGATVVSASLLDSSNALIADVTADVSIDPDGFFHGTITLGDTSAYSGVKLEIIVEARSMQSVAGNSRSSEVTVDNDDPTGVSVSAAEKTNSPNVTLTITGSDATTAIEMYLDGNISGTSVRNWVAFSNSASVTLDPGEGTKAVTLRVRDGAYHEVQTQATVIYDVTAPLSTPVITAPNGQSAVKSNDTLTISGNAEVGSTLQSAWLMDQNNSRYRNVTSAVTVGANGVISGSVNLGSILASVTAISLEVVVSDGVNDSEADQSRSNAYDVDNSLPTVTAAFGATHTNTRSVPLTLTVSSDAAQMRILGDVDTGSYSDWISVASSVMVSLTTTDAEKTITVQVRDAAHNSGSDSASITLDTIAPDSAPVVVLPGGQSRLKDNDTITVAGAATGAQSIVYAHVIDDAGSLLIDATADVTMDGSGAFSGTIDIGSQSDGSLIGLELVVQDYVNESVAALSRSAFYLVDNSAPTDGAIEIAGGAAVVGSATTVLGIAAIGATEIYIDGDVIDTPSTKQWIDYTTSVEVILTTDMADNTVTVTFRDEAHNSFGPASDTVALDTSAVSSSPSLLAPGSQTAVKSNDSVSVKGNSEAGAAIVQARLLDDGDVELADVTSDVSIDPDGYFQGSFNVGDLSGVTSVKLEIVVTARGIQSLGSGSQSTLVLVDNDSPTGVSVSAVSKTNSTNLTLTITGSDATTAMEMYLDGDITGSGVRAWRTFANNVSVVMTGGEGQKAVSLRVRDGAYNEVQTQTTVDYDTTAPVSQPVVSPPAGQTMVKNNDVVTISGYAESGTTLVSAWTVDQNNVHLDNITSSVTLSSGGVFGGTVNLGSIALPITDIGVEIIVSDGVNSSIAAQSRSDKLTKDNVVPVVAAAFDEGYTNQRSALLNISGPADSLHMRITGNVDAGPYSNWIEYGTDISVSLTTGDAVKTATVQVRDAAFNVGSTTASITLDTVAPDSAPVLVLPGTQNRIKDGDILTVDGLATGGAIEIISARFITDTGTLLQDIFADVSMDGGGNFSGSFNVGTLTHGDLVGIEVVVKDQVNRSEPSQSRSAFYLVDNNAPSDGSIEIAGGASVIGITNTNVSINAFGATHMYISGSVENTANTNAWISYSTSESIILTSTVGSKVVSVLFRDEAHNTFGPASDSITLDTSAVTASPMITPPNGQSAVKSNDVIAIGGSTESGAEIVSASLLNQSNVALKDITGDVSVDADGNFYGNTNVGDLSGVSGIKVQIIVTARMLTSAAAASRSSVVDVDNDTPVISAFTPSETITNASNITLSISASDATTSLQMFIDGDISGVSVRRWIAYSGSTSVTLNTSAQGTKAITLRVRDEAFNEAQAQTSVTYDSIAPASSPDITAPTSGGYTQLEIKHNDDLTVGGRIEPGASIYRARLLNQSGSALMIVTGSLSVNSYGILSGTVNVGILPTTTTSVRLEVIAQDSAGNYSNGASSLSDALVKDITAPSGPVVSIEAGATHTTYNGVTVSFTSVDPDIEWFKIDDASSDVFSGNYTSLMPIDASVYVFLDHATADDGETKTVTAVFYDGAMNPVARADSIILDEVEPWSEPLIAAPGTQTAVKGSDVLTVTGSAAQHSSILAVRLLNQNGSTLSGGTSNVALSHSTGAFSGTYTLPNTLSGVTQILLLIRVEDDAGNQSFLSSSVSNWLDVDTVAPDTCTLYIKENGEYTNKEEIVTSVESNNDVHEIYFSGNLDDNESSFEWINLVAYPSVTLNTSSDGLKTVTVRCRDGAHNLSSTSSDTIYYDGTAPTVTSVTIAGKATLGSQEFIEVNDGVNSSISVVASDAQSGVAQYYVGGSLAAGAGWAAWTASGSTQTKLVRFSNGEGLKTVYAYVEDEAGNISLASVSDSAIKDYTTPSTPAFSGASFFYTNDTDVVLSLSTASVDQDFESYQKCVAASSACSCTWADTTETSAFSYTLNSDGTYYLCVRGRDVFNNYSTRDFVQVIRDATPPSTPQWAIENDSRRCAQYDALLETPTTEANFSHYELRGAGYSDWFQSPMAQYDTVVHFDAIPQNQTSLLSIRAVDLAGNVSEADILTLKEQSIIPIMQAEIEPDNYAISSDGKYMAYSYNDGDQDIMAVYFFQEQNKLKLGEVTSFSLNNNSLVHPSMDEHILVFSCNASSATCDDFTGQVTHEGLVACDVSQWYYNGWGLDYKCVSVLPDTDDSIDYLYPTLVNGRLNYVKKDGNTYSVHTCLMDTDKASGEYLTCPDTISQQTSTTAEITKLVSAQYYTAWIQDGDIKYAHCTDNTCYTTVYSLDTGSGFPVRDMQASNEFNYLIWADPSSSGSAYGNYEIKRAWKRMGAAFSNIETYSYPGSENNYDHHPVVRWRTHAWQIGGVEINGNYYSSKIYYKMGVDYQEPYDQVMDMGMNVSFKGLAGPRIIVADQYDNWYFWDVAEESGTVVTYEDTENPTGPVSLNGTYAYYVDSFDTIRYINMNDYSDRGDFFSYSGNDLPAISARSNEGVLYSYHYNGAVAPRIRMARGQPGGTVQNQSIHTTGYNYFPYLRDNHVMYQYDGSATYYCRLEATGTSTTGCESGTSFSWGVDTPVYGTNGTQIYYLDGGSVKKCTIGSQCTDPSDAVAGSLYYSVEGFDIWSDLLFHNYYQKTMIWAGFPMYIPWYSHMAVTETDRPYGPERFETAKADVLAGFSPKSSRPKADDNKAIWADEFYGGWDTKYFEYNKGFHQVLNASCLNDEVYYDIYADRALCSTGDGKVIVFDLGTEAKQYYNAGPVIVAPGADGELVQTISGVEPTPNRIRFMGVSFKAYTNAGVGDDGIEFEVQIEGRGGYPDLNMGTFTADQGYSTTGDGGQWYDLNLANTPALSDFYLADVEGNYKIRFINNSGSYSLYIRRITWRFTTDYQY